MDVHTTSPDLDIVFCEQLIDRDHELAPRVDLGQFWPLQRAPSVDARQSFSYRFSLFCGQRLGLLVARGNVNDGECKLVCLSTEAGSHMAERAGQHGGLRRRHRRRSGLRGSGDEALRLSNRGVESTSGTSLLGQPVAAQLLYRDAFAPLRRQSSSTGRRDNSIPRTRGHWRGRHPASHHNTSHVVTS